MTEQRSARISRDTRRLLATVLLSLAALWIIARIRFPEQPPSPNPVAPVLTQIAPRSSFEDLERAVLEAQPIVSPALLVVTAERVAGGGVRQQRVASLRFGPDAAMALTDGTGGAPGPGVRLVARDPAAGLTVYAVPTATLAELRRWSPARLDAPRYLLVSDIVQDEVSLRPAFVSALAPVPSLVWSGDVWKPPDSADLRPGSFVFTTGGSLVGMVATSAGETVVVPTALLLSAAQKLRTSPPAEPGWIGVEVRGLSAAVREATGVGSGVVVTWVDPRGPAAGKLRATDIVQAIGSEGVSGPNDWGALVARLAAGQDAVFRVRRATGVEEIHVTAVALPRGAQSQRLGLTLRRRGTGSVVLAVEDSSLAMRAGIRAGDLVTRIGELDAPTPAQIRRALANARGQRLLLAVTRGSEHLVVALGSK